MLCLFWKSYNAEMALSMYGVLTDRTLDGLCRNLPTMSSNAPKSASQCICHPVTLEEFHTLLIFLSKDLRLAPLHKDI
jgi:hypothetical protein